MLRPTSTKAGYRGDSQPRNHPKLGASIKVDPIRDLRALKRIKTHLRKKSLRDYCLLTLGINTAYRASELLSLKVGQVKHLKCGDVLEIKQSKNNKYRTITLNHNSFDALQLWLDEHPDSSNKESPLFLSQRSDKAICVSTLNRIIKKACAEIKLEGNYGSHSMRKTWGYHQRKKNHTPIALLMIAFGHSNQKQTLDYLGIQDDEVSDLFMALEL